MENRREENNRIAESLRLRVENAQAAYRQAMDEYKSLMAVSRDISQPLDSALSDGVHATRRAMTIHRQAREDYEQALKNFTEFLVYGTLPEGYDE